MFSRSSLRWTQKRHLKRKGPISWAFAEDINRLIDEAKKAEPAMAEHLPELIKFIDEGFGIRRVQHIDYIHVEIMLNRIVGTIQLFQKKA